jgi:RHS repeat-associated protein
MAISTPAAVPTAIAVIAKESSVSLAFWLHASGLASLIQGLGAGKARPQEKQSDRNAKVSRIQIFPGDVTIGLGDQVSFSAVAYDRNDTAVGGVKFKWSGKSSVPDRGVRLSQRGSFVATTPGSFSIEAEGAGKTGEVTVTVLPGVTRNTKLAPISTREVSSRDLPSKNVEAQKAGDFLPLLPGDGWGDSNHWSADDPENRVGNPPGAPMDEGAGSGNFQIAAPVLSLPGRGIDVSLALAYNSRLWNRAGSQISFDLDRGWPAPGWSLGFGKLLGMGVNNGAMLVDADGTRHSYTGTITFFPWGTIFVGHTTDGTFIDYTYTSGTGGGIVSAQAKLPNGTVITYGAGPGHVYPTSIEDENGNYITITYLNNTGPRIQTIVDTLNRPINFHYDPNNLLTAITGPGLNGTARTLVRLHYRQLSLNYSFSGLTAVVAEPTHWVIDAVYYPGTNIGYWFGETNSYSTYGMLARVSARRNMSFSAASLNEQGTINSAGSITRERAYNYPLTTSDPGGSGLTDAPTFTSMTESWTRDGVNTDQAITNYSSQPNASPRTATITLPNGTKSVQYSHNAPGSFLDGLVFQDQTLDSANNVLQSSTVTWQPGAYDSPRPTRVEATNELSQMMATEFSYGAVYNQITEARDFDYGGVSPLRVTRTQYQNSVNYTGQQFTWGHFGRHIFNLPLVIEVFDGDGLTRVSRTDYQYDGQTLTATPNVVQHDLAFNPHAEAEGYCFWDSDWSDPDCNGPCVPGELMGCDGHCPQIFFCPYDPSTDYRGNITQVTRYGDAINLTGAVTEARRYDITGNVVTATTSCCVQTSFNYTIDTQYAYPLSQIRGSATDPFAQVNISSTVDFNTGLLLSETDANGRQRQTSYDSATLRVTSATSPTGAHTDFAYNDTAMSVSKTTRLAPSEGGGIAHQNVKLLNGRSQVRREEALASGGAIDVVESVYDNMGRISQQSRPFRSGVEQPQWDTTAYDALGRAISVTAPDGSTTQSFYNEASRPDAASGLPGETTRVRDAWGRERWGRADSNGRLVEIVEPNPSGTGSVATGGLVTTYAYTTLGKLSQVSQAAQTRSFQYDSLGRLTAQKLAEASATLNDAGTYIGAGTWSDVFTYDDRSNLIAHTDARGVKTVRTYNNDPLNRLQSVSWDTSGFGDTANPILPSATVTYQYRQKSSPSDLKDVTQLAVLTTSGISTETYAYDAEGRVSSKTLTVTGRASFPFVTDYIRDTLDRLKDVRYPAEYGNGTQPRKVAHHDYDVASRVTGLSMDGAAHASQIVYDAGSQTTSLKVGLSGANQITENYAYSSQTGLLENQTVVQGGATTLLNLSYDYTDANGKRTGQLTRITNNLVTSGHRNRSYSYDALGRLVQARGGPFAAAIWSQTYTYDRHGNRTSVAATGHTARLEKPEEPKPQSLANLLAFNSSATLDPPPLFGHDRSVISDSDSGIRLGLKPETSTGAPLSPQSGPPVFTDDPLTAGVTIKAVHVTELRTAVNQARSRVSLPAASWAESVSPGVFIKAAHIVELRARLDEARAALGLPAASYTDPTLTVGITVKAVHVQELRQRVTEALTTDLAVPVDGHANLSYDPATNRITTAGFAYDAAGNQVRALIPGGASQRFQYDAANRLVRVKADDNVTVIATYTYGSSNVRLVSEEAGVRTYYDVEGTSVIAEYVENSGSSTPAWSKSYVYLGARLLSTLTPNGAGGAAVQHHHPDRIGTRVVSNPSNGSSFEQLTLPFGTPLNAESTGTTNRRFTTYERDAVTGLDYAVNRHYDPQQGRFTQVDPIGMRATELANPQSLNLYAYCGNDPINTTDPTGLGFLSFFKKLFKVIKKVLKIVAIVAAVALVMSFFPGAIGAVGKVIFGMIMKGLSYLGPFKYVAGAAAGEGGRKLNPIGLIFTGILGIGYIASRFRNPQDDDDIDVVRITVNCPRDSSLPCLGSLAVLLLAIGDSIAQVLDSLFGSKPKKEFDACEALKQVQEGIHHESPGEFGAGEVVKESSGAPGTHPTTGAGQIGSRVMPIAGGLGGLAPGISMIELQRKCLEQRIRETECLTNPASCRK